ncbi:hypothetical protein GCM10011514_41140 [Emticicia aquatilis]|uniref:Uncharacterized protein n=1 Tax=Emticicia aquatilis TaxID=1537369 RepID=A0A917DUX4_9BACT|nr:hypothetical protein GCM10011514_41140 [Emticicia aquatilis]
MSIIIYSIPLFLFFLLTFDELTFHFINIFPLSILLVFLAPFSIIGIIFNIISPKKAKIELNSRNKEIAEWMLFIGILGFFIGVLGLMVVYLVIN